MGSALQDELRAASWSALLLGVAAFARAQVELNTGAEPHRALFALALCPLYVALLHWALRRVHHESADESRGLRGD